MSIKEQLKAEIERQIDRKAPNHDSQCNWEDGYFTGLFKALAVIDTIKEPPSVWTKDDKEFMDIVISRIFGSPNITTILSPVERYKFEKALTKIRNKMDL